MGKPSSLTLSPRAVDLVSAALRHVRDAEHLLDAGAHSSVDQAYHLAPFGPECARKAALSIPWLDKPIGHGVGAFAEDVLELALAIDPIARRYDPVGYATRYPSMAKWTVDSRYDRTGKRDRGEVVVLCQEARTAVDAVVVALWADGRFPDGATPW